MCIGSGKYRVVQSTHSEASAAAVVVYCCIIISISYVSTAVLCIQSHAVRFCLFSLLLCFSFSLCVCRQNLKREGFRGLTNPYCQLNVGRQGPYTTDVVFDSANPSWEHKRQTFEFRVSAVY